MDNYNLGFIDDDMIFEHVKKTVQKYRFSISLKEFNKNLIDPIKLTFDAEIYGKSIEDIILTECMRQIDKSNSNHIGYFHQNLFQHISPDWEVPKQGFDVVNKKKCIFAEIKNKHNTMNSSSSQKTYMRMQAQLLKNNQSLCFLVEVIAKNSQNVPWIISLDGQQTQHPNICRVSIDQFYTIVTGDAMAYQKLCANLPRIIHDAVVSLDILNAITNTVLEELSDISDDFLTSLYMMAFEKYQGFDSFHIKPE
ncbi:Eco47II family restriction endonuclease [[Limnothrix rosea] IAM M-220]|uniref:Eco47II family restriction endonuclease n=1 Tax=[Limnothrix rosea] IAM M-220 TaxID=454133 RepID=UPI000960FCDE|nr:Eco47II family restriction endonuclease [[Limnothrix rosea] IAM M-220]OKH17802.1 restriction endonuclease [[Limnothrix rosea] IAM M-220]